MALMGVMVGYVLGGHVADYMRHVSVVARRSCELQ
jgi:hypothetical protein